MRLHRALLLGIFCLLSLALDGCNTGKGVTDETSQHAALRFANVIPDASGSLNVVFDNVTSVSGLGFEGQTQYQEIGIGPKTVQVSVAGTANTIINATLNFVGTVKYTYLILGPVAAPSGLLLDDTTVDPGAGNFALRIVNAAPGIGAVDIYVTPPGASLDLATPSIASVVVGGTSAYAALPAGNVEIRVTPASSKEVIYDAVPQTFAERAQAEAIVYTRGSAKLVNVAVLNIDAAGTGAVNSNLLSQFKVINGSSVASPLNVFVDHKLVLSNIPFTGASSYEKTTAGAHTITLEASATPGATLLTLSPNLASATDSSIVITGPAGALRALMLTDNNLSPAPARARVRFVNSSTDVSALDVFVNFAKQVAGLAMNSGSSSVEFDADATFGTSYEIDFNVAGTTRTGLSLPAVTLLGGKKYSIYVVGSGASLAGVVTQDN